METLRIPPAACPSNMPATLEDEGRAIIRLWTEACSVKDAMYGLPPGNEHDAVNFLTFLTEEE